MNLEAMTDGKLEQLYRNCLAAILENKPNRKQAEAIIDEINLVWQARLDAVIAGNYKPDSPETGVLKTVGYQVGNQGLPAKARRAILDYVIAGTLPFVGSPAHMREWGEPNTLTRYRKLHRVLAGFRTSAGKQPDLARAHDHWDEDIDYIEREWRPKVH